MERALFLSQKGSTTGPPARRQFAADAWSEDESVEPEDAQAGIQDTPSLFERQSLPPVTWLGPAGTRQVLQLYADQTQPSKSIWSIIALRNSL